MLTPPAAAASDEAGFGALVRTDISGAAAALPDADGTNAWKGDVAPGTLYLGAQADDGWRVSVDGTAAARSPAFGWANSFAVTTPGHATLSFDTPITRPLAVLLQAILWLVAIGVALQLAPRGRHRGGRDRHPTTRQPAEPPVIIDLGDEDISLTEPAEDATPDVLGSRAMQAALNEPENSQP
jgi:hypothetical protein